MSQYKAEIERAGKLADDDQPDAAMDIINRVLVDEPDNHAALYVAAVVMLHAARHVQAIQIAKRLTELKPKGPLGWGVLALLRRAASVRRVDSHG